MVAVRVEKCTSSCGSGESPTAKSTSVALRQFDEHVTIAREGGTCTSYSAIGPLGAGMMDVVLRKRGKKKG